MNAARGLVVALLSLAALATAAAASAKPRTIAFVAVVVSDKATNTTQTINDNDFVGKRKIGHDTLTCNMSTGRCTIVVVLSDGTITSTFLASGAQGTGKIVSGTGAYAGAKGTFAYKVSLTERSHTAITLKLV